MQLEAFKQFISLLEKNSERSNKLYKLGFEIYPLQEELERAITLLLKSHYSEQGEEIISSWLFESNWNKLIYNDNGEITNVLSTVEDLHSYVEKIRTSEDFVEFEPKPIKKKTRKQIEKRIKEFLKN